MSEPNRETLKSLIYLWTRDAKFPVQEATVEYIVQHLCHIKRTAIYSDTKRADMAGAIVDAWLEEVEVGESSV